MSGWTDGLAGWLAGLEQGMRGFTRSLEVGGQAACGVRSILICFLVSLFELDTAALVKCVSC